MFSKPCTSGTVKRKHVTLSVQQKLEIIDRIEKGENRNKIMEEYKIGSSTIYDIKKNKDKLKQFSSQTETMKDIESRKTLKKPKLHQLDEILYNWFCSKRSEGKPVTGPMLMEKGKQFRDELNLPETECVFSDGWLYRFKTRHGIRKLDVAGELRSADHNAAEEYKTYFDGFVEKHNLTASQIYNADETGLLWRCLPNSTLAGNTETCAKGFKKNKDRLTVLFCSNASGNHMLTPYVIGKYKKPRAFKGIVNLPVNYAAQTNAWMSKELFKDWFFHHFVPSVKDNLKKIKMPEESKVVLLLDNCAAHPAASELISKNISAIYLPANVTSLIQPMDQGVIQNFKCFYRASFLRELIQADCSVINFQKKFNIKDAVLATALAWGKVKETTIQKSWRKLWPKAYEEDNSDVLPVETDIVVKLLEDAQNEIKDLPAEEVKQWISVDDEEPTTIEITDELIIQSVLGVGSNEANDQDVESDEEGEDGSSNTEAPPTWHEAAAAINTFVRFAECSKSYNTAELLNLCVIKNNFFKKKTDSKKQKDIRSYFK